MQTKSGCRSHPCPSHEVFHAQNMSPWHLGAVKGRDLPLVQAKICHALPAVPKDLLYLSQVLPLPWCAPYSDRVGE